MFVQEHANGGLCFEPRRFASAGQECVGGGVGAASASHAETVEADLVSGYSFNRDWRSQQATGSLGWFTDCLAGVLTLFLGETASLPVCLFVCENTCFLFLTMKVINSTYVLSSTKCKE